MLHRHLVQIVVGLLYNAQICADGRLIHIGKAQSAKSRHHFFRRTAGAELTHIGRSQRHIYRRTAFYGGHGLEYLALVGNGAEGAIDKTLTAGGALVVIYGRPAIFVLADSAHAAGRLAGPLLIYDGVELAFRGAAPAADALFKVYVGLAVDTGDSLLWADLHTWMLKTALAAAGDGHLVVRALVAGKLDDVYKGHLVILFRQRVFVYAFREGGILRKPPQGHTQCQPQSFAHHGPLLKYTVPVAGDLAGNDFVWQLFDGLFHVSALVSHTRYLGEHLVAYSGLAGLQSPHRFFLHAI